MLAVAPMRGHAALGDVVHVLGADLHFDALLFRPDHRGVDASDSRSVLGVEMKSLKRAGTICQSVCRTPSAR